MKIGEALDLGNTGELITVKLPNGRHIIAIAGNVINSTKVLVAGGYALCETSPEKVLEFLAAQRFEDFPQEEEEEEVVILPFQVLFISEEAVWLGGDRSQLQLTDYLLQLTTGGINNLGQLSFLAVWEQSDCNIIQNKDFAPTINVVNEDYCPLPAAFWIGSGILTTPIQREEIPEIEPVVVETGSTLPPWVKIPPYPVFFLPDNTRVGTKTETKVQARSQAGETPAGSPDETGKYNYSQREEWDYRQASVGGSPNQDPYTAILPACDFFTSGTTYAANFDRNTRFDYSKTITEAFLGDIRVWWNNQPYVTTRNENYDETYTLEQTPALFQATTYYACQTISPGIPGFEAFTGVYQWVGGSTFANFTGETTTVTRSYTKIISEELNRPVNRVELRITNYELREEYNETSVLVYPSENWTLPQGVYGYDFEVQGEETKTITHDLDTLNEEVSPLLLSGAGVEAVLLSQKLEVRSQKLENKTSSISKILRDNTTSALIPSNWMIVTNVERVYEQHMLYLDGESSFALPIDRSFHIVVDDSRFTPDLGYFTLQKEEGASLLLSSLEYITAYREEKNRITNTTDYYEVEKTAIPFWENLEGNPVYLLANNLRYTGVITSLDYEDNPHPDLEIDVIRTVHSITMQLISVEDYPMTEPDRYELYPQDDATRRVFNILNSDGRNYCNLVGNFIYYAKNVVTRLEQSQQTAEVFQILDDKIIQLEPETGTFIPVSGSEEVLGISYYPL
ncbi:MAG: hypothetical protein QNJ41_12010 [Xenococcaceae cyanobacterium MO_188.B32]|nr:hypothetical protein [Xenococcaceae cyanobacterium MO_188.B32]